MTYLIGMSTLDEVIAALRGNQAELRRHGVLHAGVFGSIARRDDRPDSDVDVLVELDPDASIGLYELVRLERFLKESLGRTVDIANRRTLKPRIRPNIERDLVNAF